MGTQVKDTWLFDGKVVNDADYFVTKSHRTQDGKKIFDWICPYYRRWYGVAYRVFSGYQLGRKEHASYEGVTLDESWCKFSTFKVWMTAQTWVGLELDKDILVRGSREYGPETCAFVPQELNKLLVHKDRAKMELPIGVRHQRQNGNYCSNVREFGINYHLGTSWVAMDCHHMWQLKKADIIVSSIDWYKTFDHYRKDVVESLYQRVDMLRDDAANGRETIFL